MKKHQDMSERANYLIKLNEAFAGNDVAYVSNQVTDDIRWNVVGDNVIEGKEAFTKMLNQMASNEPYVLTIDKIMTHGMDATVTGIMKSGDGKEYAFCDIYTFNGFNNAKIREMHSYVIELKQHPA